MFTLSKKIALLDAILRTTTRWWFHLLFWLFRIAVELRLSAGFLVKRMNIPLSVVFHYAYTILQFYLFVFVIWPYLFKRINWHLLWKIPLFVVGEFALLFALILYISVQSGALTFHYGHEGPARFFIQNWKGILVPWLFSYLPLSLAYFSLVTVFRLGLRSLKEEWALLEAKRNLDLQLRLSELDPHLFFNTLLVIRNLLAERNNREVINRAIGLLQFYLENKDAELIPLEDEVEQCRQLLEINRFRFGMALQVGFDVGSNLQQLYIVPKTLLILLENIFKHGHYLDAKCPAYFSVQYHEGALIVETRNRMARAASPNATHIGLQNLKEILANFYEDSYCLETNVQNGLFTLRMEISMERMH